LSTTRKCLRHTDNDGNDDDSSDLPEKEPLEEELEEEVFSEESSMKLDTSEEKLYARRGSDILFKDDGDTPSMSSEPRTPESHRCSDEESSDDDDDDDFWM
jgi:hypothetical protein